ncbi:Endoribonuclease YBEY, chloroplastic-like protein [Drosera capensis]
MLLPNLRPPPISTLTDMAGALSRAAPALLPLTSSIPSKPQPHSHFISVASLHFGPLGLELWGSMSVGDDRRRGDWREVEEEEKEWEWGEKEVEFVVKILIENGVPDDPEILLAFDSLKDSDYKTRDSAISDIGGFEHVELSILLCNDVFICKLNKEWRDEDHATDVLSVSNHIPGLNLPILMVGDIVISVETVARQAEERRHNLLDETWILLIHGLLHLLGFDHEISMEAEAEMEKQEELLLKSLDWKGNGLIKSAHDTEDTGSFHTENHDDRKKEGSLRFYRPKFKFIFCDIDGTFLNSESQITLKTAKALREVLSNGIKVVIASGKTRPAAISILRKVGLAGTDGVVSESSPGVFLQGLLVYGRSGQEIFRRSLHPDVCRQAFNYSLEHRVPVVAFCEDRCLTLFDHSLVDSLHSVYSEPKEEVMTSVEHILAAAEVQVHAFVGLFPSPSFQI